MPGSHKAVGREQNAFIAFLSSGIKTHKRWGGFQKEGDLAVVPTMRTIIDLGLHWGHSFLEPYPKTPK